MTSILDQQIVLAIFMKIIEYLTSYIYKVYMYDYIFKKFLGPVFHFPDHTNVLDNSNCSRLLSVNRLPVSQRILRASLWPALNFKADRRLPQSNSCHGTGLRHICPGKSRPHRRRSCLHNLGRRHALLVSD